MKPYPINPACTLHIRAIQDRFPKIICLFRYYDQYWKATKRGYAVIPAADVDALAVACARRGTTVATFDDLHETPFKELHTDATGNFVYTVKPD